MYRDEAIATLEADPDAALPGDPTEPPEAAA
jgi:hypothetical protein